MIFSDRLAFASCDDVCEQRGCFDFSASACQRCPNGFILDGACVSACPPGYYVGSLDPSNDPTGKYACLPCYSGCSTCTGGNPSDCLSCPGGLAVLDDGTCGFCDMDVEGYYFNSTCVRQCPDGMWNDGDLVACSNCSTNCLLCAGTAESCTKCNPGSFLFQDNATCLSECPAGTYEGDGVCDQCANEVCRSIICQL